MIAARNHKDPKRIFLGNIDSLWFIQQCIKLIGFAAFQHVSKGWETNRAPKNTIHGLFIVYIFLNKSKVGHGIWLGWFTGDRSLFAFNGSGTVPPCGTGTQNAERHSTQLIITWVHRVDSRSSRLGWWFAAPWKNWKSWDDHFGCGNQDRYHLVGFQRAFDHQSGATRFISWSRGPWRKGTKSVGIFVPKNNLPDMFWICFPDILKNDVARTVESQVQSQSCNVEEFGITMSSSFLQQCGYCCGCLMMLLRQMCPLYSSTECCIFSWPSRVPLWILKHPEK